MTMVYAFKILRKSDFHLQFNTFKCEYRIRALHTLYSLKIYLPCIVSHIHNTKQGLKNQERKRTPYYCGEPTTSSQGSESESWQADRLLRSWVSSSGKSFTPTVPLESREQLKPQAKSSFPANASEKYITGCNLLTA